MYHRIAGTGADPWQLAVSPQHFEEQLEVLANDFHVITVPALLRRLQDGQLSPGSVCLTFDDGYADNYLTACPLLEKYRCPATFFIVTGYVGQKRGFWWDSLGNLLLNTKKLPGTLAFDLPGERCSFSLDGEAVLSRELHRKHLQWHYPAPPPGLRAAIYLDVYERLKGLPPEKQEQVMQEISAWGDTGEPAEAEDLPVSREQLISMSRNPLLEIGLHTHTHPALGAQPVERQHQELESCREYLDRTTSGYLPVISYPHGHYNQDTLRIAKEQQLLAAFTTEEQAVTGGSDPYRLGRFQVGDWDGKAFKKQLSEWMGGGA